MALDVISFSKASKNQRHIEQVDEDVQQENAQYPYTDIYPELFNSSTLKLGPAEDGDWSDGLFSEFTDETSIATALDRFHEVLKSLAPPPAPELDDIDRNTSGVTAKLSFGATNSIGGYTNHPSVDVNGTYSASGNVGGVFNATTNLTGTLNEDVPAHTGNPNPAYPANAFGNGDQGTIKLLVNGSEVHSEDLSTYGSGTTSNGNGSGFTLTAATSCVFASSGDPFEPFKYRTGSYTVDSDDMRNGYNYCQVQHVVGANTYSSDIVYWIVNDDTTATAFSAESISNISMAGSKYISGAEYHTSGTIDYTITLDNIYIEMYIVHQL